MRFARDSRPWSDRARGTPWVASGDSELRETSTAVGALSPADVSEALRPGLETAGAMREAGLIAGAALALQGQTRVTLPDRGNAITEIAEDRNTGGGP